MKIQRKLLITKVIVLAVCLLGIFSCSKNNYKEVKKEVPTPVYYTHVVKYPGETLGIISIWYTGTLDNWKIIDEANPNLDVNKINIGDRVLIPDELLKQRIPLVKSYVDRHLSIVDKKNQRLKEELKEGTNEVLVKEDEVPDSVKNEVEGTTKEEIVGEKGNDSAKDDEFLNELLEEESSKIKENKLIKDSKIEEQSDIEDADRSKLLEELLD